MATRFCAAWQKPRPIQAEFSVTLVFCVPIICPNAEFCRCHCALKWQGGPHLAFANGVGRIRLFWNLLNASLRATKTQRSVMTGSIFEPSRYRFVRVAHLQIRPAWYGDRFHKRCGWPGRYAGLKDSFFKPANALAVSAFCSFLKRR